MLFIVLLAAGAAAHKYKCSRDINTASLRAALDALHRCGTPTEDGQRACYENKLASFGNFHAALGYEVAEWEAFYDMPFNSMPYITHYNGGQKATTFWRTLRDGLENGNHFCWYVRDPDSDGDLDSFGGNISGVFFIDDFLREPVMYTQTVNRMTTARTGTQCFPPDLDLAAYRLEAIRGLRDRLEAPSEYNTKLSTDIAISALLARLKREYHCAGLRCTSTFRRDVLYLPQSPQDLLAKVEHAVSQNAYFCFVDAPIKRPILKWYYFVATPEACARSHGPRGSVRYLSGQHRSKMAA